MNTKILLVDDDRELCTLTGKRLQKLGYDVTTSFNGSEALDELSKTPFEVVLTDVDMPGMDGIELTKRIVETRPNTSVIIVTFHGNVETAVSAIRAGAFDFITKPFEMAPLDIALKRAVEHTRLREEVRALRNAVERTERYEELVGESAAIQKVCDLVTRAARTDVTVLITGESGTGKELVARALHRRSRRQEGPFVAINCSALPETLLESELFGHAKGAFTDAKSSREGLFAQANGGTLFLDEIGEMPVGLQAKILRALEERAVRPVGGNQEVKFDVRIVSATNRDLPAAVESKIFREDLYYRLNVIQINLPALRDRGRDVLLLAQGFVRAFAGEMDREVTGITPAAAGKLLAYSWPGNVRELKNCIERAVALTTTEQLTVEDLPEHIQAYKASHVLVTGGHEADLVSLEVMERRYIESVMAMVDGNKTKASRILGIDRKSLYRKLERFSGG
jgi:DNA-binding NtrC family response regulator